MGKLFLGWFRIPTLCSNCELRYERDPGYFLGSTYINYALTAFILTVSYFGLHVPAGYANRTLIFPLTVFCVIFPLAFFRYARSFWLALDCFLDAPASD